MIKILVSSTAALAFIASSVLPVAALTVPRTGQMPDVNSVTVVKHRGDSEWWYKKKRRYSRPRVYFYYNPWPYYGYRYDPHYYRRGPYWNDYFYDYDYFYRPRVRFSHSKHVKWCRAHYRTYNVRTDKFTGRGGKKYWCDSPYDRR